MQFDPQVPSTLQNTQIWFGNIITLPIDLDSQLPKLSSTGNLIEEEAKSYIASSPTLKSHERIQIYAQQYWWRLLSILQDNFPLLLRLFGPTDFNQTIAMPFLQANPPKHWSLNVLGELLPDWLKKNYQAKDSILVYNSAYLDWVFLKSFIIHSKPPLTKILQNLDDSVLEQNFTLQPHTSLLQLPYHLLNLRKIFLEQTPEYWVENDFPPLTRDKQYYFVIYRSPQKGVAWKEASLVEFSILTQFQTGTSISSVCEWLEKQPKKMQKEAMTNLRAWFQDWTLRDLFHATDSMA